jgi:hypothetical protein
VLMMIAGLLIFTNIRVPNGSVNTEFQDRLDVVLVLGMWVVALPYLAWIALRRPHRLLGRLEASPATPGRRSARFLAGNLTYTDLTIFLLLVAVSLGMNYLAVLLTPSP